MKQNSLRLRRRHSVARFMTSFVITPLKPTTYNLVSSPSFLVFSIAKGFDYEAELTAP